MAATNVYVDAVNGSDAATGATWALAWKTLDKAIARIGFAASSLLNIYMRTGVYTLQTTNGAAIVQTGAVYDVSFIGCGFVVFKQLYGVRWMLASYLGGNVQNSATFRNIFFDHFDGIRCLSTHATYQVKLRFENCIFNGPVGKVDNRANYASKVTCVNCSSLPGTVMPDVVNARFSTISVTADAAHVRANNSSTNYGYLAFDDNAATYWDYASGTTNVRLNVDLAAAKTVRRVLYGDAETTKTPKTVQVYGSNISGSFANLSYTDDTGWDYVATVQFLSPASVLSANGYPADGQYSQYTEIPNTGAYRYYSFKIANNWGGTSIRLAALTLQEATAYVDVLNFLDVDTTPATATSFSQIDYTRCSKEGAIATGTNGATTNPIDRSTFTGALLPVPVQYSSGGVFVVADPLYMNINVVGATTPYFPCSSTGWANDTAFTSGTATISDTNGIDLASGSSAAVLSPVYDFARTANFAGVGYSATEVATSLGTASVTLQYRVSASAFYQTTAESVLGWNTLNKLVDQSFSGRYLQYRVTLNLNG